MKFSYNEFHISKAVRDKCNFSESLYSSSGNVIITSVQNVRIFTEKLNKYLDSLGMSEKRVSAGQINAMGLIDEILHYVSMLYSSEQHWVNWAVTEPTTKTQVRHHHMRTEG